MSGFITIERKLWDHPLFKPEPMTEREAWMWMLARASYAGTRHSVGGKMIDVPRGSFMATLREMQSAFMWKTDKKVRTFLDKLERNKMVARASIGQKNSRKTHVTICNYDEYQSQGRTKGDDNSLRATSSQPRATGRMEDTVNKQEKMCADARRTHEGRTKDAVNKQGNKETIDDDDNAGADQSFREKVLVAAGHDPTGMTASGRIVGNRVDFAAFSKAISDLRISEQDAVAIVAEIAARKRDGPVSSLKYFVGAFQQFAGARDAPPVKAVVNGQSAIPPPQGVVFDLKKFLSENPELNK